MITGSARITAVDPEGKSFVNDVQAGDLWLFPGGMPHSIQGLGPDGCKFLLVFNQGDFDEFCTFLLSDWFKHTPKEVLAKNFNVPASTFDNIPKEKLYIFQSDLPRPLAEEQQQAGRRDGNDRREVRLPPRRHEADESYRGRRSENHRQQEFSGDQYCCGDCAAQAGRTARDALASALGRVAVLCLRPRPHDGV